MSSKYVFKIGSYDAAGKKFTFDDTYTGFANAFSALEVGSKLFVQNFYYINSALVFTVNSIGSDGKSIVVEENIPSSNFDVYFATIIQALSSWLYQANTFLMSLVCTRSSSNSGRTVAKYSRMSPMEPISTFLPSFLSFID